jgi:ParB-like chromosome segregation protein Spo0J
VQALRPLARLPSFRLTMALRLQLSPRAARALSLCPPPLREQLERELAQLLCGRSSALHEPGHADGPLLLGAAGLRLRYRLDRAAGRLHLLELGGPWLAADEALPAPACVPQQPQA